mmetsp:Transcript_122/g.234  ORF Transcript_122/g.234 Transcript_122/m.234 type:complete len:735 (-) Transcript_122:220-2424(-)
MSQVASTAALRRLFQRSTRHQVVGRLISGTTTRSFRPVAYVVGNHDMNRNVNISTPLHNTSNTTTTTTTIITTAIKSQRRNFGKGGLAQFDMEDDDEDMIEMEEIADFKSAEDMDFYDATTDDFGLTMADIQDAEKIEAKRQAIRAEIDSRKGRLWKDRLELTDADWASGRSLDDLPDWSDMICSRVSLERVQVHPDGIPTLEQLANISLPPTAPPHPALGNPHPYVKQRKSVIFQAVSNAVQKFAEPKMEKILAMENWVEKQDAIDDLFEHVSDAVKKPDTKSDDDYMSVAIASMPNFPKLVERALEEYLRKVVKNEKLSLKSDVAESEASTEGEGEDRDELLLPSTSDGEAVPVFMDLLKAEGATVKQGSVVPKILNPLKAHHKDGPGRMVEEWELAANDRTRRIMCRESIREIASVLHQNEDSRVFVTGQKGAGKTAALAAIVASARTSGNIVLYMPDGDRLRKHGFYIEPNKHVKSADGQRYFDLPVLSKEVCGQLIESHAQDLEGMIATKENIDKYISSDQRKKLNKEISEPAEDGSIPLQDLLRIGSENVGLAAACYSIVVKSLMNQTEKTFTIVADEFNCYYDYGQYFHAEHDPSVERSIPPNRINLFQPIMDAMGLEKGDDGSINSKEPLPIKNGGIVVGLTGSHAVARKFTNELTDSASLSGANIVHVSQYSALEAEHILANFEIVGIGRLRFDRGETVMDKNEVAYLRMVSGGYGQALLDACVC